MLVYSVILLVVLSAFCSLAVDLGRVQLAKTELRRAVDAAARYAATGLAISPATARSRAKAAAIENTVDGAALALADSEIELGRWDDSTSTFTVLSGDEELNANALRINASCTSAKGNAIPLSFARVIGLSSCNISASAVTRYTPGALGVVGLNGITFKNNAYIGSYNSSTLANPSSASARANAGLGSNGAIQGGEQ